MTILPIGLVIIEWDTYQGATEFFKYPPDFDQVSNDNVQQIQISHNFISSVMFHRDDEVNVISYYNDAHKKVIALFLSKYEEGRYYKRIIERFDDVLSQNLSKEDLINEIIEVYKYSFTVINAREEVMDHLTNKVSTLTEIEHDFNKRISKLLAMVDGSHMDVKILTALILHKKLSSGELFDLIKTDLSKSSYYKCLKELETQKYITRPQRGIIQINF